MKLKWEQIRTKNSWGHKITFYTSQYLWAIINGEKRRVQYRIDQDYKGWKSELFSQGGYTRSDIRLKLPIAKTLKEAKQVCQDHFDSVASGE